MIRLLFTKYRFYTLSLIILTIWMSVFDDNDMISQYTRSRELGRLEDEKEYYQEKLKEVQREREEVLGNPKLIEKYAREKYLMKKAHEELYILVDEDNQPLEK
ncbi:MAG: FtsB family cell division protein [Flectobacillus sp.]|uniref:FtsB family cell division protein n=1 Tax=Flectobacillus sp. TaxID=50419 RepID=UPI003B9BDE58